MRVKITKSGIYGALGEIAIGTEFTVKEAPAGWAGRCEVIGGNDKDKTPVTNPAEPVVLKTAAEVMALVDGNFMALKSAAKDVLGDATPAKKDEIVAALIDKLSDTEIKTYLAGKGVETKDETRDQLVDLAKAA